MTTATGAGGAGALRNARKASPARIIVAKGPSSSPGPASRPDQLSLPCGETKNSTAFGPAAKASCTPFTQSPAHPAISAMLNANTRIGQQYLRLVITLSGNLSIKATAEKSTESRFPSSFQKWPVRAGQICPVFEKTDDRS